MKNNNDNENDKLKVFEDEKHILLDHDYDGIRELNHPLPSWWLGTFILTVIFGTGYYIAYTFLDAKTINQELAEDLKVVEKKQSEFEAKQGKFNLEEYTKIANDPKNMKAAKKLYKRKCSACHGKQGEGGVGPNLSDKYWLHGDGSLATVYNTINKGVIDKGMASWGPVLGKEKVYAILKYVSLFQGTNPAGAKAPQGQEYK